MAALTTAQLQALDEVSAKLGMNNPKWLEYLIQYETGGTFNPLEKNPLSSARGLIQFMNSTAKNMGYRDSLDLVEKHPEFISQLKGPVYEYLKPYAPYKSEYELNMAVFFPAARKYSPSTSFESIYRDLYGGDWRKHYSRFQAGNPGINSPQDYMDRVKKNTGRVPVREIGGLVAIALAAWYFLRRKR